MSKSPFRAVGVSDYSATEHLTGANWIDGKPIYRVVVSGTTTGATSLDQVLATITGLTAVISCLGTVLRNDGRNYTIGAGNGVEFTVNTSNQLIFWASSASFTSRPFKAIIEYTK